MEIIEFALGLALVWVVLNDVFSTVIVPRPTPSRFRPAALLTRIGWRDFQAARSPYAGDLNALATFFAAPPALWIGDRTAVPHAAVRQPAS